MNYELSVNISALSGAFVTNLKGRTETKQCICIPISDAHLYRSPKTDAVYLNIRAFEPRTPSENSSHYLKQDLPKEYRETLTEEQRRQTPIIGHMKVSQYGYQEATHQVSNDMQAASDNDLPF